MPASGCVGKKKEISGKYFKISGQHCARMEFFEDRWSVELAFSGLTKSDWSGFKKQERKSPLWGQWPVFQNSLEAIHTTRTRYQCCYQWRLPKDYKLIWYAILEWLSFSEVSLWATTCSYMLGFRLENFLFFCKYSSHAEKKKEVFEKARDCRVFEISFSILFLYISKNLTMQT